MILRDEEDDEERESEALRRLQHNFLSASPNLPAPQDNEPPLSAAQHTQGEIQINSLAQPVAYSISLLACICLQCSLCLHMSTFYKLPGVFDDWALPITLFRDTCCTRERG